MQSGQAERREVPEICTRCGNYLPQFYRIIASKECAAFGTCDGVKNNRCGAWCKIVISDRTKD